MRTTWVRPRVLLFNPECRRREGASRRGDARRWTREPVRLRDISLPVPAPGSVGEVMKRPKSRLLRGGVTLKRSFFELDHTRRARRGSRTSVNAIERLTEAMATTKPHMASQREVCFPREPAQNPTASPPTPGRQPRANPRATAEHDDFPDQPVQDLAAMRRERQTALKETADLRRELNGGAGPLNPKRVVEIHEQLDAKMAAAAQRKAAMLAQEKERKRERNAARLSAAAARVANQRDEKYKKIAGKVAGKEARREDLKDRSRGQRANIARRFDRPNPDTSWNNVIGNRRGSLAQGPRQGALSTHGNNRRVSAGSETHSCDLDETSSRWSESDSCISAASEISLGLKRPVRNDDTAVPYNAAANGWNDRTAVLAATVSDCPTPVDVNEKAAARVAALRAAAEARWNMVNTTVEEAKREYAPTPPVNHRLGFTDSPENACMMSKENSPPTPIHSVTRKDEHTGEHERVWDSSAGRQSRRSSEEFTFSPPAYVEPPTLANLSALMSSRRSSGSMSSTPVGMDSTHNTHDSTPAAGTPSEELHSARSIRESAVKVLDSPEATRAMELSETLLSRLEEEFELMESIQAQAAGGVDADPIDSWLAKAGEAGAKGIAESRELKIQLASSHLTYLDVESETEDDDDEDDDGATSSPAGTTWANASMEARRDEDSPAALASLGAEEIRSARGGISWLSPLRSSGSGSGKANESPPDGNRTADSVPTALFRDEASPFVNRDESKAKPTAVIAVAGTKGDVTICTENGEREEERRAAAAARVLEDELTAAAAVEAAAEEAARAAEARAAAAEEEAAKLAKEVADARARARAARAREEAELRAKAEAEAEAAKVAASVQSAMDDEMLWKAQFTPRGTPCDEDIVVSQAKKRSPKKKKDSPVKKKDSPVKKDGSPVKKDDSPVKKDSPKRHGTLADVRQRRRAQREATAVDRAVDLHSRLRELESQLEASRKVSAVNLAENDGARDESWLDDDSKTDAKAEAVEAEPNAVCLPNDDRDETDNPWLAPPSPESNGDTGTRGSKGSRMGAMAAEMEPLDSDAEVEATSSLRDVAIESEGTMRSNGPPCVETAAADAERRARLEREEAQELRRLLRKQEERRRRRRRRLERRGEKVADFLPLFAVAAVLGGAGKLIGGALFGRKLGRR